MIITSTSNAKIKALSKLKNKSERLATKQFIVEGDHLVEEAHKAGLLEEIFYVGEPMLQYDDVEMIEVSQAVLEKLCSTKTPQRICGVCHLMATPNLDASFKRVFLLDTLQDPGNIGTIIRTALAMGFDAVILSNNSVDLYQDKLLRSAQGALFQLPVLQSDLIASIQQLQDLGFKVYGTSLHHAHSIHDCPVSDKMAFVLGNEGNGVSEAVLHQCDGFLYIPIVKAESLNVAIAGGMIAYAFSNN